MVIIAGLVGAVVWYQNRVRESLRLEQQSYTANRTWAQPTGCNDEMEDVSTTCSVPQSTELPRPIGLHEISYTIEPAFPKPANAMSNAEQRD